MIIVYIMSALHYMAEHFQTVCPCHA